MIDVNNEIFQAVATAARNNHTGITVTGEFTRQPSKFPMVTLDETQNVMVDSLEDSSNEEKFAGVRSLSPEAGPYAVLDPVRPRRILAITFTNKAANEQRQERSSPL